MILLAVSLLCFSGSFVIIVSAETLVLLLIAVPLIIVAVRKKKTKGNILQQILGWVCDEMQEN